MTAVNKESPIIIFIGPSIFSLQNNVTNPEIKNSNCLTGLHKSWEYLIIPIAFPTLNSKAPRENHQIIP
jgi:hypothetical protein